MSEHPITLTVPDHIYDRAQKIAKATALPVEEVLLRQLEETLSEVPNLPPDEQAELAAFKYLSDDTLHSIAREQMTRARKERMQTLMAFNSKGTITADEHQELAQLVELGDRLMLRKAWAAGVLMDRGHSITSKDLSAEDE
jgi:hypothetical protein